MTSGGDQSAPGRAPGRGGGGGEGGGGGHATLRRRASSLQTHPEGNTPAVILENYQKVTSSDFAE